MNKVDIFLIILFCIIIFVGIYHRGCNNKNNNTDTLYNTKIDSLVNEINHKDSIVIKLNKDMKDEINKSYELNDTASLMLFYKLCKSK